MWGQIPLNERRSVNSGFQLWLMVMWLTQRQNKTERQKEDGTLKTTTSISPDKIGVFQRSEQSQSSSWSLKSSNVSVLRLNQAYTVPLSVLWCSVLAGSRETLRVTVDISMWQAQKQPCWWPVDHEATLWAIKANILIMRVLTSWLISISTD